MSEHDLRARALRAAAAKRIEEEQFRRRWQELKAKEERDFRTAIQEAASRAVFEKIGEEISPDKWELRQDIRYDSDDNEWDGLFAETRILGIRVRTGVFYRPHGRHLSIKVDTLRMQDVEGIDSKLTLANLGMALEAMRTRDKNG